jgi:integrase
VVLSSYPACWTSDSHNRWTTIRGPGHRTFDRLVARTGLPRIRFHDVRHTHASLLLKAGVPVKVVSERLGHATPSCTLDVYGWVLPGMQAEAAAVFSRLLTASTGLWPGADRRPGAWATA